MSPPTSLARVRAALKRFYPPALGFQSDTSKLGLERNSIGLAIAYACDVVESIFAESFPDTTSQLIDRWEKVTRVPTRTSDDIATRRTKVLSVLRRTSGARLDQLGKMLAGPLGIDANDMMWVEPLRSFIEEALTETTGVVSLSVPTTAPGLTVQLGRPWPGVVDDAGVMVYVALSGIGTTTATLTSPDGAVWTIPVNATSGWYFTRSVFTGRHAGGAWTFNIVDSSAPTLTEFRLLVSNDVDSAQIYNFFVLRDPTLPGTADLVEAQRLFHRTALANMRPFVIETLAFTLGDPHSLMGRDPIGVQ